MNVFLILRMFPALSYIVRAFFKTHAFFTLVSSILFIFFTKKRKICSTILRWILYDSILLNVEIFKILKTIFFTYFEYTENNGGIYFANKWIDLLFKKAFPSGRCFLFTLETILITLLELIFGVVFGPIFSS